MRIILKQLTIPTCITLVRLCAAPLILPLLFVCLLPFNNLIVNGCVLVLFAVFSLTDLLDGFLARYYCQESALGRALDPIADKFLFYSCFVGLLAAGKIFFLWVIIFIGRDFLVMGLRYIALQHSYDLVVSSWGKLRTAVVMMYIGFLILNPYHQLPMNQAPCWYGLEIILLILSLLLTLWSAYAYYSVFERNLLVRLD
jgi:cardiolipin synthase